jgi:cell division septum initiation protein DivIVA
LTNDDQVTKDLESYIRSALEMRNQEDKLKENLKDLMSRKQQLRQKFLSSKTMNPFRDTFMKILGDLDKN